MFSKLVQLLNAHPYISFKPFGSEISFKFEQSENADEFIFVTLAGITSSVNPLHPLNALLPTSVSVDGRDMLVKYVQLLNALAGRYVIPSGTVILVSDVQP